MAERRKIGSLAQAGPIELVAQRTVLDERVHGVKLLGQPGKAECPRFFIEGSQAKTLQQSLGALPHWSLMPLPKHT